MSEREGGGPLEIEDPNKKRPEDLFPKANMELTEALFDFAQQEPELESYETRSLKRMAAEVSELARRGDQIYDPTLLVPEERPLLYRAFARKYGMTRDQYEALVAAENEVIARREKENESKPPLTDDQIYEKLGNGKKIRGLDGSSVANGFEIVNNRITNSNGIEFVQIQRGGAVDQVPLDIILTLNGQKTRRLDGVDKNLFHMSQGIFRSHYDGSAHSANGIYQYFQGGKPYLTLDASQRFAISNLYRIMRLAQARPDGGWDFPEEENSELLRVVPAYSDSHEPPSPSADREKAPRRLFTPPPPKPTSTPLGAGRPQASRFLKPDDPGKPGAPEQPPKNEVTPSAAKPSAEQHKGFLARNKNSAWFKTARLLGDAGLQLLGARVVKGLLKGSRETAANEGYYWRRLPRNMRDVAVSVNSDREDRRTRRESFNTQYGAEYEELRKIWLGQLERTDADGNATPASTYGKGGPMTEAQRERFEQLLQMRIQRDPLRDEFYKNYSDEYKKLREKALSGGLEGPERQRFYDLRSMRTQSSRSIEDLVTSMAFTRGGDEPHSLQRRLLAAKLHEYFASRSVAEGSLLQDAQNFSKRYFRAKTDATEIVQDTIDFGLATGGLGTTLVSGRPEVMVVSTAARSINLATWLAVRAYGEKKRNQAGQGALESLHKDRLLRLGLVADRAATEGTRLAKSPLGLLKEKAMQRSGVQESISQRRWKAATLLVGAGLLFGRTGVEVAMVMKNPKQMVEAALDGTAEALQKNEAKPGEKPKGVAPVDKARRAVEAAREVAKAPETTPEESDLEADPLFLRIDPFGQVKANIPDYNPEVIKDEVLTHAVDNVLESRMGKQLHEVAEALGGKDSDAYKKVLNRNQARILVSGILRNPVLFGMKPHIININEFTPESLKGLKWDDAMKSKYIFGNHLAVEMMTAENLAKYANHNPKVKKFFEANPDIPITSHTVHVASEGKEKELVQTSKVIVDAPTLKTAVATSGEMVVEKFGRGAAVGMVIRSADLHREIAAVLGGTIEDVRFLAEKVSAAKGEEIDDAQLVQAISELVQQTPETGSPELRIQQAIRRMNRMTDQKILRGLAKHAEPDKRPATEEEAAKATDVPPDEETAAMGRVERPSAEDIRIQEGRDGTKTMVPVIRDKPPIKPEETLSEPDE